MDVVCEVCGDVGFKHLLVQCNNCKDSTRHRYCTYTIVYDGTSIEWLCDDCLPKCNEPVESLEAFSDQREQNHIQLYPSMNSMEDLHLSKENDCCFPPKHVEELFPQGTNSDSFPLINNVERCYRCVTNNSFSILQSLDQVTRSSHTVESVERPHLLKVVKPDGSDHSALDPALESKGTICFENITGNFIPTLNSILPSVEQADGSSHMEESVEHSHPLEVVKPDGSNHSALEPGLETKKIIGFEKCRSVNGAGNALLGNPNVGCAQNDTTQLASQDVVTGGHCSLSSMPVMSAPSDQQCYIPIQPIDKPCWTGLMKIGSEYISLAAHLSNKACKKVQELSRSLPPVMKTWRSSWEELEPIAENISLYFFLANMRPNKDLEGLMKSVTDHRIVLKYTVGLANLLIFHSVFLPEKFQMFQAKHFLCGVFKREKVRSKGDPPVKKQDCTSQVVKKRKDKLDKVQVDTLDQENHVPLVKKQGCTSQFAKKRKDQQDKMQADALDQEKPVLSVKKQDWTSQVVKKRIDQPEKVQVDTLDQENPVSNHNIPNDNQPLPDTVNDGNFAQALSAVLTKPGDDGKSQSSSGAPAPMLSGLADAQTPRSRRDLRLNLKEMIRLNLSPLTPR